MPMPMINASGITKTYREDSLIVDAVKEVNLTLPVGALAVIIGPSGGGKSTLLHIFGGLDKPDSGTLEVAGVCLDQANERELNQFRRQNVGFVFIIFSHHSMHWIMCACHYLPGVNVKKKSAIWRKMPWKKLVLIIG